MRVAVFRILSISWSGHHSCATLSVSVYRHFVQVSTERITQYRHFVFVNSEQITGYRHCVLSDTKDITRQIAGHFGQT